MFGSNVLRLAVALALIGAFASFSSPAAAQDETGTITVHSRLCADGEPTTDIFTECHDTVVPVANSFSIDGGGAVPVDASGNVSFTDLVPGAYLIAQEDGVPLDFAYLRVFCSVPGGDEGVTELAVDVNKFTVEAVAGEEVVCDVYTIPEDASGQTPTAVPTTPSGGTTTLPNTGIGSASDDGMTLFGIVLFTLTIASLALVGLRRGTAR